MLPHSALCEGVVRHRRFLPKPHQFRYRVVMTWLDLDEVPLLDQLPFWSAHRLNLVQYRRDDFINPAIEDIKQAVYQRIEQEDVTVRPGKIYMLTNLRTWGLCFNPVTFYFCTDRLNRLYAIVAEINNTPWNERHAYVLSAEPHPMNGQSKEFSFAKTFHVSPFMPMELKYQWRFRVDDNRLSVHMKLLQGQERFFDATMGLTKRPLTPVAAKHAALGYPFMCARVIAGIYWQALRLWLKRIPFYNHPSSHTAMKLKGLRQGIAEKQKILRQKRPAKSLRHSHINEFARQNGVCSTGAAPDIAQCKSHVKEVS